MMAFYPPISLHDLDMKLQAAVTLGDEQLTITYLAHGAEVNVLLFVYCVNKYFL